MENDAMQLWAGLGNPGAEFAMQRHNVGFMVLDAIAEVHGFAAPKQKFRGWAIEGRIGSEKLLLLKPATFMNRSGEAIGEAMRFYKLEPSMAMFWAIIKSMRWIRLPICWALWPLRPIGWRKMTMPVL
jgi:peptidyl-tRNA hydrolase